MVPFCKNELLKHKYNDKNLLFHKGNIANRVTIKLFYLKTDLMEQNNE